MIEAGELPEPGPGPEAMDAWLEECRQAGAGDLRLTLGYMPAAPPAGRSESEADFLARLARIRAEAEAKSGTATPEAPPMTSLVDELRAMGWM